MTAKHTGHIVLAGGAGYLGRILTDYLVRHGRPVVVLTRNANVFAPDTPLVRYVRWDGETVTHEWARELEGAAAVVNLAGRSVNCRYHARNRRDIYESRLRSTRAVGEAIARCENPPPVWLNSSSATIYRHAEDREMDEARGEIGDGFSVDVCRKWEAELAAAPTPPGVRKVALRTAMVLDPAEGGVLEAFTNLARRGLGGAMAGGRQYVSWIHSADFCAAVEWLMERDDLAGPVNLAAPEPVTNTRLMSVLRRAVGRPFGLPAARWMLEVGALLMGTESELIVKSRRVVPGRLLASGFAFRFPEIEGAVADLLGTAAGRERRCERIA